MKSEQHKFLYNIGMELSCDISGYHLCPGRKNYEYFVYWSEARRRNKKKFETILGREKVQLKRSTGTEQVSLEESVPVCSKYTDGKRIEMVMTLPLEKEIWESMIKESGSLPAQSIRDVAIEKTLVLKEINDSWQIPMIDFIDVFDGQALLTHFRSLIHCLLGEIIVNKNVENVISRMIHLFQNWEQIYSDREDVLGQIKNYMNMTKRGIEGLDISCNDLTYFLGTIKGELRAKEQTGDFLSFLLPEDSNREHFQECITVLNAFLSAYTDKAAKGLFPYLQKYENKSIQINQIRRLTRMDLASDKAKTANAKLIDRYLADEIKYRGCGLFECIA